MKTCLYDLHVKYNGKMVDYNGYLLPVEYQGISHEHEAVRKHVGVFDVSHMGEVAVNGKEAAVFLDAILTNNATKQANNTMQYNLMLDDNGMIIDDLMVYKFDDTSFLIITNACNNEKDYNHIKSLKQNFDVTIANLGDEYAQIALQGPLACSVLSALTAYPLEDLKLFSFAKMELLGNNYLVSRSGYTGSDGFEIYGDNLHMPTLFAKLVESGVTPCGLGARDTLRFEAAMPLYGHEIGPDINPLEATLSFAIDFEKDFIGKQALLKIKEVGLKRKLVGLQLPAKRIARSGYLIYHDEQEIGYVTTGYMIPNTEECYALAYIDKQYANIDSEVLVLIRKNLVPAKIRNKKFMKKDYKR